MYPGGVGNASPIIFSVHHSCAISCACLEFVTGLGGTGFALGGPAITRARGPYFLPSPRPAPVRGPTQLMPWTGPRFSPPRFYGGLSRAWVGRGPGPGWEGGKAKNMPHPGPVSGPGRGISPGACVFRGPGGPVTNTTHAQDLPWVPSCFLMQDTLFISQGIGRGRNAFYSPIWLQPPIQVAR
jgi:hypothetical protein